MKAIIINRQGQSWEFSSVAVARQHLKGEVCEYDKEVNGEIVRVFDLRPDAWERQQEEARKLMS